RCPPEHPPLIVGHRLVQDPDTADTLPRAPELAKFLQPWPQPAVLCRRRGRAREKAVGVLLARAQRGFALRPQPEFFRPESAQHGLDPVCVQVRRPPSIIGSGTHTASSPSAMPS